MKVTMLSHIIYGAQLLPNFYHTDILKGNKEGMTMECLEYLYQLKHYSN